jgi:FdhD protein
VAVEEPLAVVVTYGPLDKRRRSTVSITMRTPGHDPDLAVGLLFAEQLVRQAGDVVAAESFRGGTMVRIDLHPHVRLDLSRVERLGYASSACGVCGKTSIDAIEAACEELPRSALRVPPEVIHALPGRLRESQLTFARTGGLHAAALFDCSGRLLSVREDVGRHNAVDKVIGAELLAGRLPLADRILLVSGRAGFELIQKAALARIPIFAAVGAPSSLAVSLAKRLDMTLIGFVRDSRFNIYSGAGRVVV